MKKVNKALFVDRDNTIIFDAPYMADPAKVRIMPGVGEALGEFRKAGYLLIIVTNQSGIGRGLFSEQEMFRVHERLKLIFESDGIFFDDILYCPHSPEEGCSCRKPLPGLLLEAAAKHDINLAESIMVGDKIADVEAGIAAGCRENVWLSHGRDKRDIAQGYFLIAEDLPGAVKLLL